MLAKQVLDRELPISLATIEPIIDKICKRYPYISKPEVVLITKSFFECIRFILVQGNVLSINNFIGKMQIVSFSRVRNNKRSQIYQAKISTSAILKQ